MDLTTVDMWNYCPGPQNPADLGLRGCFPSEIAKNQTWREGPQWLKDCYPKLEGIIEETDISEDCLKEFQEKSSKKTCRGRDVVIHDDGLSRS